MLTFTLTTQPQPSDLNRQSGLNAYRWMSMNPERRADSDIAGYVAEVLDFAEALATYAVTEAQKIEAAAQVEAYRLAYLRWTNTLWASKSRTASPMVTGPANFPVERNRRAMEAESKKVGLFLEWLPRAKRKALQAVKTAGQPPEPKPEGQPDNSTLAIGDVSIVTNYDAERIQIIFPGKPDAETITKLKGAAWKWSPKNTAWQRMITPASMRSAKQIVGA